VAEIESKLTALGLLLPPPITPPAGVILPFEFVRINIPVEIEGEVELYAQRRA
jgi:hypothetical protein